MRQPQPSQSLVFRIALLPIGAYRPRWFMSPHHMSPEEAVHAHQVLNAATRVGIHFGTFRLGNDGQEKPAADLRKVLHRANIPARRFWILDFGEGRDVLETEKQWRVTRLGGTSNQQGQQKSEVQ